MSLKVFDHIYVLNLPQETSRKKHMIKEFKGLGIEDFEIIRASSGTDEEVQRLFQDGLVQSFPPCFRCGKNRCSCKNNFLSREQVANWCSFLRVFECIVQRRHAWALICEDDLHFQKSFLKLCNTILGKTYLESQGIKTNQPLKIGLGRAFSLKQHLFPRSAKLSPGIVMCNPCFALNWQMAELYLNNVKMISSTSDVFFHREMPLSGKGQHFHLVPSPVYDLSTGWRAVFPSTIRPKALNPRDWRRRRSYISRRDYKEFLCIGHPRSGTRYTSEVLRSFGYDVGHEKMGEHGTSSWLLAVNDRSYPFGDIGNPKSIDAFYFEHLIHVVRNPFDAVPSIILENRYSPRQCSYLFRKKHIEKLLNIPLPENVSEERALQEEVETALQCYLAWSEICRRKDPEIVFRVEYDYEKLFKAFGRNAQKQDPNSFSRNARKPYEGVRYEKPVITKNMYQMVRPEILMKLESFCLQYGYPYEI